MSEGEEGMGMGTRGKRQASGAMRRDDRPAVVVLWVAALSILIFGLAAAPSFASINHAYLSSFGPDGTAATDFMREGPIAVDHQTQAVYVIDLSADALYKFNADGEALAFGGAEPYIAGNEIAGLSLPVSESQVAVDSQSHVVYVTSSNSIRAFKEDGEPSEFTAGPAAGTSEVTGFTKLVGVAVDANGNIYASDFGPEGSGTISIYAPTGEPITSFEAFEPVNIAVASSGTVYVNRRQSTVLEFTASEFPVTGGTTYAAAPEPLNSSGSYGLAIDPSTDDVYVAEEDAAVSRIAQYDATGALLTTFAGAGEEGELGFSEGVAINGQGDNKVYVSNLSDTDSSAQVEIFHTPEVPVLPPTIGRIYARDVTADSAILAAQINPNTLETSYRFEYGLNDCSAVPDTCTAVPSEEAGIGSGSEGVEVFQQIANLQPGTTYHFQIVAHNSLGTTPGPDRTFTTQLSSLDFRLPDSRAWEMVSPPNKFGGSIDAGSIAGGMIQAAVNGDGLAYMSSGSIEPDPEGNRALEFSSVLAQRSEDGWHSEDITPPHTQVTPLPTGYGGEYKLFSPDLAAAMLEPRDGTLLSPQASEQAPYLRENSSPPTYSPLVTSKEGYANVPPGTEFGGTGGALGGVRLAGASPDLDHVVLESTEPLVPGAAPSSIYKWEAGQLKSVSKLPEGTVVGGVFGSGSGSVRHALSDDGSRAFWSPGGYDVTIHLAALYVRDFEVEETMRVDVAQPDVTDSGEARPAFQGASVDGTKVFFTDSQRLTKGASPDGRDLYRCEIEVVASAGGCASLTDLSSPIEGSSESAEVQGVVSALSDDGTKLYFVAHGVLDTASNDIGESAVAGQPNLYLWQEGLGARFVARLSGKDLPDWGNGTDTPGLASELSAASSPSGRYFSFMSERSLTGYDNRDAVSGELNEEVFRYAADTEQLVCVSCKPTNASPDGLIDESSEALNLAVDPQHLWQGRWVAAVLPSATEMGTQQPSLYRPRAVLDNGRVFFNAADSLVPADSNGNWDVYQYEPTGLGSCTASSGGSAVARSGDGCVGLISSGSAEEEAAFLDASPSGDDVFILTPAELSVEDGDDVNDIYDARVNGRAAVLAPIVECLGEACQPPPIVPSDATPGSAGFEGAGNLRPKAAKRCAKSKHRVRRRGKVRCVSGHHHKDKGQRRQSSKNGRAHE
jgi:hypothetical protein